MIVADFLDALRTSGQPVFESANTPRDLGRPAERSLDSLREFDRMRRATAPSTAPDFDAETAHAAAGFLCRLAQFTVFRDIPEEQINTEWQNARTLNLTSPGPVQIWSADLTLSYLPDLARLAGGVAEGDPLLRIIRLLAECWPMSGVGVPDVNWTTAHFPEDPLLSHPCLSRLLTDRVIDHRALGVASLPQIRARLNHALGDYQKSLAPWLIDIPTEAN